MPLFHDDPTSQSPGVVVGGSIAVELDWALAAAGRPDFQRDHPVLDRVYQESPELLERVRSFWGPGEVTSCGGSIEIMILAHHGGLLFCLDAAQFLGQLEEICADGPGDLRLASETAEDRAALLARLSRLRSSGQVRRRYVELLSDVWSALSTDWEGPGRAAVKSAVAVRQELQRKGLPWREVAGNIKSCNDELLSELVRRLGPQGVVAIVPAYFAHLGSMVDLPGAVLVGVRADGLGSQARARTELLARRLKTLSDPTRLAMLEAMRENPYTVSELAAHFSLAQPTVSNHIKLLREAGIVSNRTVGGRRVLTVEPDVVVDLLDHLGAMFALPDRGAPTAGRRGPLAVART